MACTKKSSRKYEILVYHDVTDLTCYERLRFVLHASSWFPRPLGIFLWSVVHILCILPLILPAFLFFLLGMYFWLWAQVYCAVAITKGAVLVVLRGLLCLLRMGGALLSGRSGARRVWSGFVERERGEWSDIVADLSGTTCSQRNFFDDESWRRWSGLATTWWAEAVRHHDAVIVKN